MPNCDHVVLVVEDHPIIRMGAMDLVRGAGFEAVEADGADQAIAILEARNDVHLVFTDISMPGSMDGLMLAHLVRGRWPPVLLIVGYATTSLPTVVQVISKPFALDVLVRRI